jgi:hypothetical protein
MAEQQFNDLYYFLRYLSVAGVVILVVEWIAGLGFIPLPFRWGIQFIHRSVAGTARDLPRTRTNWRWVVLVPGQAGEWLYRPPQHLLRVSTPFPLHGQVISRTDGYQIIGRHPVGGALFFGGVVAQQVLLGFAPLAVPSFVDQGFQVEFSSLGYALLVATVFYGGSLLLERYRFLRAVDEIGEWVGGQNHGAA